MSRYINISLLAFFMTFSTSYICQKSVTRVATRGPWLLSSRVMSTFAITSYQYTITLYTPGHLQISWDVFAKKISWNLELSHLFHYYLYCRGIRTVATPKTLADMFTLFQSEGEVYAHWITSFPFRISILSYGPELLLPRRWFISL